MQDTNIALDVPKGAPTPSRIMRPGVRMPPGVERYVVAGGGSLSFLVYAGDQLALSRYATAAERI